MTTDATSTNLEFFDHLPEESRAARLAQIALVNGASQGLPAVPEGDSGLDEFEEVKHRDPREADLPAMALEIGRAITARAKDRDEKSQDPKQQPPSQPIRSRAHAEDNPVLDRFGLPIPKPKTPMYDAISRAAESNGDKPTPVSPPKKLTSAQKNAKAAAWDRAESKYRRYGISD